MKSEMHQKEKELARLVNREILADSSVEIFPANGIARRVTDIFAPGRKINITTSPGANPEATMHVARDLRQNGFEVVPHIAASQIETKKDLIGLGLMLSEFKIDEIFVIKGDGERRGEYGSSLSVIEDLLKFGFKFERIGIAGYPEEISGERFDKDLISLIKRIGAIRDMGASPYILTQMCFDTRAISLYAQVLNSHHVDAPIMVGIPAPIDNGDLYKKAIKCGVGMSKERLRERFGEKFAGEKLADEMVGLGLENILGYHIYTFNKLEETSGWLNNLK